MCLCKELCCVQTTGGVRRGRVMRGRVTGGAPSEGLKLTELLSIGVRADILQTLLPRGGQVEGEGEGGCGGLIPFDQVIMRGEDVTGQSVFSCAVLCEN